MQFITLLLKIELTLNKKEIAHNMNFTINLYEDKDCNNLIKSFQNNVTCQRTINNSISTTCWDSNFQIDNYLDNTCQIHNGTYAYGYGMCFEVNGVFFKGFKNESILINFDTTLLIFSILLIFLFTK